MQEKTEIKRKNKIIGISKTGKFSMCSENGNNHITITGASGTGKTYLDCVFILQNIVQGIPVVVIDVGNSFSKNHLPYCVQDYFNECMVIYEAKEDIHINPFTLKKYMDDEIYDETPNDAANRIAGIFKTSFKLGSQQYSSLLMAVTELMNDYNDNIVENVTIDMIYDKLMSMNTSYARNVALKIYPVMNGVHFSKYKDEVWVDILNRDIPRVTVFQLSKLENYIQKMTADFIIDDLNKYISINGSVEKPFVLIIDELQKISTKSTGELPLDRLMVEGRKFGAGLICSTQLIDFNKNNKLYKQLAQVSTRIYFKPALSEIAKVASILSIDSNLNWKAILKDMGVGCCIVENGSVGDENDKLVKVVSLERLIDTLVPKN